MPKIKRTNPFTHPPVVEAATDEPIFTVYVIGPISGIDNLNREAFEAAKWRLEDAGYCAIIPHDIIRSDTQWLDAIISSLYVVDGVDGIAILDGSGDSPGASIEMIAAMRLGRPTMSVDDWIATGDCQ